jgi:hypothetical protein
MTLHLAAQNDNPLPSGYDRMIWFEKCAIFDDRALAIWQFNTGKIAPDANEARNIKRRKYARNL